MALSLLLTGLTTNFCYIIVPALLMESNEATKRNYKAIQFIFCVYVLLVPSYII